MQQDRKGGKREKKRKKKGERKERGRERKKKEKKKEKREIFFCGIAWPQVQAGTKKFGRVERSAAERAGRIFSAKLCSF